MWACVSNFAFFALLLLQFRVSLSIDNDTDKSVISQLQIYKRLLRQKRIDHVDAAKSLADMDNYEKKYKMLKLIFDKIFLVFTEVQKSMDEDEWEAGKELPQDEKQRESLSKLFENTLFMGDLVLRIPDT
ncbi:coiled-coil domain-containing protein 134-like isoform X2 [Oscarella lobularis]|uniref:coiled-coil domain-containing protein 134-like isoform X2 n=1 Tax=Oscarella lobularis TaxID=121494 RepID=UPI003313FE11